MTFGNDVNCAANLYLIDSDHCSESRDLIRKQPMKSEPIFIGDEIWIGANVTIIKGTSI